MGAALIQNACVNVDNFREQARSYIESIQRPIEPIDLYQR
ncbi:hypothetical protein C4K03_5615 [Pseudomonas synxantha]|uniref:Uncharacterized protein n=1 Tax=Pseudomonas synxantha TaxID=47883 RepID=A0A3G7UGQ9_9PSED|nr:hypothetical protein C4K03_5615 [Pseudomonas synxantha]